MTTWRWWADRPLLGAIVVVTVIAVPGYWRLESLTAEARHVALTSLALTKRLDAQDKEITEGRRRRFLDEVDLRCEERNLSMYRTRAILRLLVHDAADMLGPTRTATMLARLPADGDTVDCTRDGTITAADYGVDHINGGAGQ